jgi:RNA polymerase sigma-70 factor (ECF subfamily)
MASLEDIIPKSAPGDPRVYECLMVEYFPFIYRLSISILGDANEADDAAQETFIRAGTHLDTFQTGTHLKSWLARIAINACRDQLRRSKVRTRLVDRLKIGSRQAGQSAPSTEEVVLRNERQRILHQSIAALDEKHRLPILLRYVHGMSIQEISQVLQLSEGTVHSRIHYAHLKLRHSLTGFDQEIAPQQEEGKL